MLHLVELLSEDPEDSLHDRRGDKQCRRRQDCCSHNSVPRYLGLRHNWIHWHPVWHPLASAHTFHLETPPNAPAVVRCHLHTENIQYGYLLALRCHSSKQSCQWFGRMCSCLLVVEWGLTYRLLGKLGFHHQICFYRKDCWGLNLENRLE